MSGSDDAVQTCAKAIHEIAVSESRTNSGYVGDYEIDNAICLDGWFDLREFARVVITTFCNHTLANMGINGARTQTFVIHRLAAQADLIARQNRQIAAEENDKLRWRKAFNSVTPGGSEYMDPEVCVAWCRRIQSEMHEAKKRVVLLERDLVAAVRAENEGCAEIADMQRTAAQRDREAKKIPLYLQTDGYEEIVAEERGERIASEIIAQSIRARMEGK